MVNELTGVKVTYGYDEFSNLVWANQDSRQFDFLYRSVDDVGNLYETKDKKDRIYGAGSRLIETKDAKFSYDEEGNLVEKVEHNGDTWKYEYYGNGMMAKILKPDMTEVTFKYDSLNVSITPPHNWYVRVDYMQDNKIEKISTYATSWYKQMDYSLYYDDSSMLSKIMIDEHLHWENRK
ncbi:hypothetical protein ACIQ1H_03145 [Lysinibacillus sp. NPDC097279]|uniref:hypothetical protein n=1 Tax=Lysinibacillus sp. NPDC097279 TaxID=3364143 RepID=UPI0037F2901B